MTLVRPDLLPLLPLTLGLVALAVILQWRRLLRLESAYTATALRRLFPLDVRRLPVARLLCLALAAAAIALGAVGLEPSPADPPPPPAPLDLAIAVDVSASMGARDIAPGRVARARQVVSSVARALPEARIALILFADWPYTLVPATDDPRVVTYFAESLAADLVLDRDQGTSLAEVLTHARDALDSRPRAGARRAILVVSDGGAHDDEASVLATANDAAAGGVQVWAAGLGTPRGGELESATGPVLDAAGAPVVVRLGEDLLRRLAAAGGGRYERVGDDDGLRSLLTGLRGDSVGGAVERSLPRDSTLLLTLLALPLLLLDGAWDSGRRAPRTLAARERA